MTADTEPTHEQQVQALYGYIAQQLQEGFTRRDVIDELIEKGVHEEIAKTMVEDVSQLRKKAYREAGMKNMMIGAITCVVGIAITAATYMAASGGGVYVVAWGAVIFGAIQFLRGVGQMCGG